MKLCTVLRPDSTINHQRVEESTGQYGDVQDNTEIYRTVQKYTRQYRNIQDSDMLILLSYASLGSLHEAP